MLIMFVCGGEQTENCVALPRRRSFGDFYTHIPEYANQHAGVTSSSPITAFFDYYEYS